jgi:glycine cleavage system H protein
MIPEFLETTIDKFILKVKMGLGYSNDHVWVEKNELYCVLGLTDYGQRRGGDIVFLEFPKEEGIINAGEPVALYETIKTALEVKAPFDCEIIEVNNTLVEQPELVNEDPFGAGWIVKVNPLDRNGVDTMLSPKKYFELMQELEA